MLRGRESCSRGTWGQITKEMYAADQPQLEKTEQISQESDVFPVPKSWSFHSQQTAGVCVAKHVSS